MQQLQIINNETKHLAQSEVYFEHFSDFSEHYIKKLEKGLILTDKKVTFAKSTIRQYHCALEYFKNFESLFPGKFKCTNISAKLLREFELYLCQNNLTKNSVSLYISKIKAIGNVLFEEDIAFRPVKYSTPKELTTKVYLSLSELKQITNNETLTKYERKVWDIFLIQCFTAMRYSTLRKFLENPHAYIKEYEGFTYIDITADKTNEQSVIPISIIVEEILQKYNGDFTVVYKKEKKVASERYVNRSLKEICKKSGIDNIISERKTVGNKMIETLVPKYKLISTHTARRTFISLAKQTDMTDREISGITAHSSEKQLNEYNRTTNLEKVKGILGHEFFNFKF